MRKVYVFMYLFVGAFFGGLTAYPVVKPEFSLEGFDYSNVFYALGSLGLVGGVFTDNFKNFMKSSSLFKKSETEDAYSDDNPPMAKSTGSGGDLDSKLEELRTAIDEGSVTVDEESIRGWCSTNGVSDEDTDYIVSVLVNDEPIEDVSKGDMDMEDDDELFNESEPEPDGDEFEKSFLKYMNRLESVIVSHGKQINEFKKSQIKTNKSLESKDKEIQFLKSELNKYINSPMEKKNPVKESTNYGDATNSRPQIIAKIKKGMSAGLCSVDDLLSFESRGKLPENFGLIKE